MKSRWMHHTMLIALALNLAACGGSSGLIQSVPAVEGNPDAVVGAPACFQAQLDRGGVFKRLVRGPATLDLKRPVDAWFSADYLYILDADAFEVIQLAMEKDLWKVDTRRAFERDIQAHSIAVAGDRVFLSDPANARVVAYSKDFKDRQDFTHADLVSPTDLALLQEGPQLVVADAKAGQIFVFDTQGELISTIGQRGPDSGRLKAPVAVAVHRGKQEIVVVDGMSRQIKKYSSDGNYLGVFSGPGKGNGKLAYPSGVACLGANRLAIADQLAGGLILFDYNGDWLGTWTVTPATSGLAGLASNGKVLLLCEDRTPKLDLFTIRPRN